MLESECKKVFMSVAARRKRKEEKKLEIKT